MFWSFDILIAYFPPSDTIYFGVIWEQGRITQLSFTPYILNKYNTNWEIRETIQEILEPKLENCFYSFVRVDDYQLIVKLLTYKCRNQDPPCPRDTVTPQHCHTLTYLSLIPAFERSC